MMQGILPCAPQNVSTRQVNATTQSPTEEGDFVQTQWRPIKTRAWLSFDGEKWKSKCRALTKTMY